ncbi:MAG: TolC family protein [Marinilabilia sp.]
MKMMRNKLSIPFLGVALVFLPMGVSAQDGGSEEDTLGLTLDKALEIALSENPSIKMADKEIEKVDYSRKEAWSGLIPSISADAQFSHNVKKPVMFLPEDSPFGGGGMGGEEGGSNTIEIGYDNSYSGALNASMPLFNMSLLRSIQMTEVEMEQALESARQSRVNMVSEVKKAYYNCLLANDSYDVVKRSLENARDNYEDTKRMYEQGAAAEYDVIRSEVQVRNLEPSLTEAENGREMAALSLKILLGLDDQVPVKFREDLQAFSNRIEGMPPMPEDDISNNSEIRQLDVQENQLEKQFEVTRAQRFPTLSAFVNYQFQTEANDFEFSSYDWVTPIVAGVQLQIPIFSGFSKKYQEKQVQVNMEQLELQREDVSRQVSVSVQNAFNSMETAAENVSSGKVAVEQARRGYEIAKTRYDSGAGTLLELNDAEVALTQARLNLNEARYNYLSAKAEYEKVLGENLPEESP